ncbi:MAG TPA: hypothetical protein VFV19_10900 [Candidatus Polarisedimenticolaceae bacterium]|nr:hypothetical protein [Candidatus Polarisedimenticolaceae bacterium]
MSVKLPAGLRLEVEEIENRTKPSCNSSSTSRLCTCPVLVTPIND